MASNPYSKLLRLELTQFDQTWTKISITVEVYEEIKSDLENWLNIVNMGTELSTNAYITECLLK